MNNATTTPEAAAGVPVPLNAVVRAERGCHTCRYRIYDTLEEPCASCNFSLADKWQPRGERSEAIAQRSGPDNLPAHGRAEGGPS